MAAKEPSVLHRLAVRTAAGVLWEPACQFIVSPLLALRTAKLLREYLAGNPAAQAGAAQWAIDIRDAIQDEGEEPSSCAVEVHKGRPGKWERVVAKFAPEAEGAQGPKRKPGRRPRNRVS